jgi:ATP-dependent Clp protease ATP-binding subunit ClpA
MKLTIPIYIEQQPQANAPALYLVRPLFLTEPAVRDEELQRAVTKFVKAARKIFDKLGRQMQQTSIAEYTFAPDIEEHTLQLSLNLKEQTAHCKFLFIAFNALGRRLAFTPSIPGLWFEIDRGESLHDRAVEVLTEHFRNRDKRDTGYIPKPDEITLKGSAQTGLVELRIDPPLIGQTPREEMRARLFSSDEMDGEYELQNVGRCLNELYPDDLTRVIGREAEVAELTRLLEAPDRRPVLLTGPHLAGKTALIEEYVHRRTARRKSAYKNKNNVWLIAPQRLISGMSFVGQWENRLLAIIKEARRRKHTLYFDDLLGLFKAGISASSNLNVAQVLKPYIERREIRVLAEITPEAWRVLREHDRGFADLFHLMPVRESSEEETTRMMIGLIRELESKHGCHFEIEALPAVLDLTRRYLRESAFPGKAAAMLRQLAVKYRGATIGLGDVIVEFRAKSGLALQFLNDSRMERAEVIEALGRSLIGQPEAVAACADVLVMAKARLNDPNRPLSSMLFLGPTGVGKTQCAKSLAACLFSNEDRMIRFDMNEFVSHDSVARLVGAFDQPEGLLTSAIRRQPFAVILLDEIEKAHPDVFNLLLQVMGEGRLTDSMGRTADFSNAIILLTSNLGVKEASSELGFRTDRGNEASIYTQAAEKFFSPEFFNRLDRVVPFNRLDRAAVGEIAQAQIRALFNRDGVTRRNIVLRIDPRARQRIVDAGFHPQLGARALKREIEKQLAQPIARRLAATPIAAPTIIDILPGPDRLRVEMRELYDAPPRDEAAFDALLADPPAAIECLEDFIERVEETLDALRPDGPISLDAIGPEQQRYFSLTEQMRGLRHTADRLIQQADSASRPTMRLSAAMRPRPARSPTYSRLGVARAFWREFFAAEDIHAYLQEATAAAREDEPPLNEQLMRTLRETALIEAFAAHDHPASRRALLLIRPLGQHSHRAAGLAASYETLFRGHFGLETTLLGNPRRAKREPVLWLLLEGWDAARLAAAEAGTHLFVEADRALTPVQVLATALSDEARPREFIKTQLRRHRQWLAGLGAGDAANCEHPWPLAPVMRLYTAGETAATVDLRSGLSVARFPTEADLRLFIASSLPLPPEFIV